MLEVEIEKFLLVCFVFSKFSKKFSSSQKLKVVGQDIYYG